MLITIPISLNAQGLQENSLKEKYLNQEISSFEYYDQLFKLNLDKSADNTKLFAYKSLASAKSKSEIYQAYSNLSSYFIKYQNYDSAQFYIQKILTGKSASSSIIGHAYNNLGVINLEKGNYEKSLKSFHQALAKLNKKKDYKEVIQTLNNIANIYYIRGETEKGIQQSLKALHAAKTNNLDDKIAIISYNIGLANGLIGFENKAIEYLEQSKAYFNKNKQVNRVAQVNVSLSEFYLKKNDLNQANTLIDENLSFLNLNPRNIASTRFMKAQIDYGEKDYSSCIIEVSKVLEIDKSLDNKREICEDYHLLAKAHSKLEHYNKSENYLNEANAIIRKIGDTINLIENLHLQLTNSFSNNSIDKDLLKTFEEYNLVKDKYLDTKRNKLVQNLEAKYKHSEQAAEITAQKLQNQNQKSYTYFALGGIVLLVFVGSGGYILNHYRLKEKEFVRQKELKNLQLNMARLDLSNLNNQIDSHDYKNSLSAALLEVQEKAPKSYQYISSLLNISETALYSDSFTDSIKNQLIQIKGLVDLYKAQLFERIVLDIDNTINENIQIPRLLLKNIVENSLKHGIKGSGNDGKICVKIFQENDTNCIHIMDNGRGMHKINTRNGKGISVYKEMFSYFNLQNDRAARIKLENLENGFLTIVEIPMNYKYV